ncbi:MAG TPA: trans-4-hydroxy-L-proline dehydratase [Vicinamibacterales bacterium]|nr:trans-4-hydroxy-L-proline dehydratase [Vicinamibacterales bacterium]
MTDRVARLRQLSLDTRPTLSSERAELMTEFYRQAPAAPLPILRALSLRHLMDRKAIHIGPGELIVGERGPRPKATPTYPELCCHTLEDLQILDSREKISFGVSEEARAAYRDTVIPFWRERSIRHRMFEQLPREWKDAYEAGIFTEFMEQRAPGHTVADDKIYRKGLAGLQADIDRALSSLDFLNDLEAYDKKQQLLGMRMAADAVIGFARRHAEEADRLAAGESDPDRRAELEQVAANCRLVPGHPPRTFWQALQAYWFIHLGVITELNTWDSFCPGRLDQHLYPFYKREIEAGTLTRERARELLQCFWIKFNNQPAPPKVGVTAAESGTYTDFSNIGLGGLASDGRDAVNEVSYLILEVIDEMRLLQPSSNIQLSKKNPDRFLEKACEIVRKGWGQPSIFNADMVVAELVRQGKRVEDARCGGTSGCVEAGAFGKESYILTGYFNLPKVLEVTLNDGRDARTGKRIGMPTGDAAGFETFDQLLDAFARQLQHFIDVKIAGNQIIERMYAACMPAPFLSILTDDCIATGRDYNNGGARYNTRYIMPVGPGTAADSLSALKYHVYDRRTVTMADLLDAVRGDFAGAEPLRQVLLNKTPKYGNDVEYADQFITLLCDLLYRGIDGRRGPSGSTYHVNYLSTTCHVYFGSVCGATPDGRRAWAPVSDGISPAHGADRQGPTAVIRSAARMDHARSGGTLLNQKFAPSLLAADEGLKQLGHLVRAYFKLDGHHIQFNVVTADTLRAAQEDPDRYRDLIVRVAGYSDYFCDLTRELQDEIIARTEQHQF